MSARFTAPDARAILVDRALSYLERLFTARDARERIIAANSLVALAAALGANLDSKPNATLVYYNSRLLRRLGVRLHDFKYLKMRIERKSPGRRRRRRRQRQLQPRRRSGS